MGSLNTRNKPLQELADFLDYTNILSDDFKTNLLLRVFKALDFARREGFEEGMVRGIEQAQRDMEEGS